MGNIYIQAAEAEIEYLRAKLKEANSVIDTCDRFLKGTGERDYAAYKIDKYKGRI